MLGSGPALLSVGIACLPVGRGVFQHPAKTKAWQPQFECQAFEFPTHPISLRVGHILNQGSSTSPRLALSSVPFFKKKMFSI
jgi:hypothetical protein